MAYRQKDIEQSHVCLGTPAHHQAHEDRHALYVLNTILGGSMSSRLFQHIRENRGLAYTVFSSLSTYSDTGMMTIYAGCANERVAHWAIVFVAMSPRAPPTRSKSNARRKKWAARSAPPDDSSFIVNSHSE